MMLFRIIWTREKVNCKSGVFCRPSNGDVPVWAQSFKGFVLKYLNWSRNSVRNVQSLFKCPFRVTATFIVDAFIERFSSLADKWWHYYSIEIGHFNPEWIRQESAIASRSMLTVIPARLFFRGNTHSNYVGTHYSFFPSFLQFWSLFRLPFHGLNRMKCSCKTIALLFSYVVIICPFEYYIKNRVSKEGISNCIFFIFAQGKCCLPNTASTWRLFGVI